MDGFAISMLPAGLAVCYCEEQLASAAVQKLGTVRVPLGCHQQILVDSHHVPIFHLMASVPPTLVCVIVCVCVCTHVYTAEPAEPGGQPGIVPQVPSNSDPELAEWVSSAGQRAPECACLCLPTSE